MVTRAKNSVPEATTPDLHERQVKHACFAFGLLIFLALLIAIGSFAIQEMISQTAVLVQPTIALKQP